MSRTRPILGISIAAALLLTGCAPESDDPRSGDPTTPTETRTTQNPRQTQVTDLASALETTPATEAAKTSFGFSDLSMFGDETYFDNMPAVGHGLQDAPLMGLDRFGTYLLLIGDILPPPSPGSTATSVGVPPDSATRFTGVADPAAVYGEASGERSELRGGTLLVRRDDFEIDLADRELYGHMLLAALNVIWYSGETVITGTNRAAVEAWVAGSGTTLAEHYDGIAQCLGDVVSAVIVSAEHAGTSNDIGIGLSGTVEETTQTLCVRSSNARTDAAAIQDRLANERDPVSGRPYGEEIPDATVEDAGAGWVRVQTAEARPSYFQAMLQLRGLQYLIG